MSGDYTYYSEGFFGFGPAGIFHPYSLMHIMPLLICLGAIVFVWYKREWFRNGSREGSFRYLLSFSMFVMEFSFFLWLLYVGDSSGQYLMMSKMPLHACDLGLIVCMFMVTSRNRTLFGINFFVTLFGAVIASILPQTVLDGVDPGYYRYYQYFGEHLIPVFTTVYMIIVHRMYPRYRDIWISVAALAAMLIPSFILNERYPGSDYLFLKNESFPFPEGQYLRAAIYTVLIIVIFHLMWLLWQLITKRLLPAAEIENG